MLSTQPDLEQMSTPSRSGKTKDKNKDHPPSRRKRNASARDKGKALTTASYCWRENSKAGGKLERHTGVRAGEPTRTVVFFITILLDLYTVAQKTVPMFCHFGKTDLA